MGTARKISSGKITKRVLCESCHRSYEYEMSRTVFGTSTDEALTQVEANNRAAEDARIKLSEKLADDCDVVACPACGAITQAMKAHRRGFFGAMFGAIGGGLGLLLAVYIAMLALHKVYIFGAVVGFGLVFLGLMILVFGSFRMLVPKKGKL